MGKITINGKPLYQNSLIEIVVSTAESRWARESDGVRTDYYRNRDLLAAFEADEVLTAEQLAHRFYVNSRDKSWSLQFCALRAGEALQWAMEHGIAEPIGARPAHSWRLLHRELQFELVGPAIRQRAVRIRGLHGAAAVEAGKLWKREQTRRRRAKTRLVGELIWEAEVTIGRILENDPLHELPDALAQFRIGTVMTLPGARQLIMDAFHFDADEIEMRSILRELEICWRASFSIRDARREAEAAHIPAEDLAMLGALDL